mmetsp:Transcript_16001/g.40144  ORF Transcript_16001/g.40144 Transcript_16001/m.40144 type:complete len:101 (+) Transcript_16001:608-910(+)
MLIIHRHSHRQFSSKRNAKIQSATHCLSFRMSQLRNCDTPLRVQNCHSFCPHSNRKRNETLTIQVGFAGNNAIVLTEEHGNCEDPVTRKNAKNMCSIIKF